VLGTSLGLQLKCKPFYAEKSSGKGIDNNETDLNNNKLETTELIALAVVLVASSLPTLIPAAVVSALLSWQLSPSSALLLLLCRLS
jgi:hypothetical protein